jgi:hypothetical protein
MFTSGCSNTEAEKGCRKQTEFMCFLCVNVRFEVLMAVIRETFFFWDVMICSL